MKKTMLKLTLVVAIFLGCGVAHADGVNVAPSSLPTTVTKFFNTYFPKVTIHEVELEHGNYEVELSNGYDVKINQKGQWIEVNAPDNQNIPVAMLNKLVPAKIVTYLQGQGCQDIVEEISYHFEAGYKVELFGKPDIFFSKTGDLR